MSSKFMGSCPKKKSSALKCRKAHDWMVSVLGPLFHTAGHLVRTQYGVMASAG
jgi:hypothetical protein